MAREFTRRLLELKDEGYFDKDHLIQDLLGYLSEDVDKDFVRRNDFFGFEDLGFTSSWLEKDDDNALEEDFA
jgi:hypothetical protein